MRTAFFALVGAMSLGIGGCGAEAGKSTPEGEPGAGAPENVGVATSELTNCTRTNLADVVVHCFANGHFCQFRLQENNFACAEGVVGQASTETLQGDAVTKTQVSTQLFGQWYSGTTDYAPVTIATQWGQAFGSMHETWCWNGDKRMVATWHMDPFSKQAKLHPDSACVPEPL
jgi:hypothetical protein